MVPGLRPYEQMTRDDYVHIGLKCGLEVHQQLLTPTKLFCRCPAGRYSDAFDAEILRHMRPTLSELGEYDGTALMEKKTNKNIYYRINQDTVCTYEFDDTPPFFLCDEALDIAIELALLLRLNMVGELHIARKQYLDGSIPTGFQRTTILGVDGWFPYKDRRIRVHQLGLEEDSCREVSDVGHDRVFLTDRLGMPLIEVVTYADMHTPEEAVDVAQIIRKLCRSTHKVRTGYGATRQDVNVSVRGGSRNEIKGVPQIWRFNRLIYNEARRQWSLLWIRDELKKRGVTPETFEWNAQDVSRVVSKAQFEPIRAALERGERVMCVALKGFAGILSQNTQEHTTFAREFSDRVRVIACLNRLPNLVHSDTGAESLAARDWAALRKRMKSGEQDALVLVWGNEQDTNTACDEIAARGLEATVGVPSDTRQALKDGTNGFERVLPGAERMYPDTDLPPIAVSKKRVAGVRSQLPEYIWDREARYREMKLPDDVLVRMCLSRRAKLFDRLVGEMGVRPVFASVVLIQRLKALRREGLSPERLSDDELREIFAAYADGRLASQGVFAVLEKLLRLRGEGGDEPPAADVLAEFVGEPISDDELKSQMSAIAASVDDARFATAGKKYRYVMGALMRKFVGRVEGRRLADVLAEVMNFQSMTAGA